MFQWSLQSVRMQVSSEISVGKDERNKVPSAATRLTSRAEFGVIEAHVHPSVGRFKANKMPFSLDVSGPPLRIKTIHSIA